MKDLRVGDTLVFERCSSHHHPVAFRDGHMVHVVDLRTLTIMLSDH